MANNYIPYELYGGTPVKVTPLEVGNKSETVFASEGCAFNPVVCDLSGALEEGSVTVTSNGEAGAVTIEPGTGKSGFSSVVATANVPSYVVALTAPYGVEDGIYLFTAVDAEEETEAAFCTVTSGAVAASYGPGTFAVDTSGDAPTLTWTPTITATEVKCLYAHEAES